MAPNPGLSMPIAAQWLETHPDMNMILGINDGSALGAYQAVIGAGKNDPSRFFIKYTCRLVDVCDVDGIVTG